MVRLVVLLALAVLIGPSSPARAETGALTSLKNDVELSAAAADLKKMHDGLIGAQELEFVTTFTRTDPAIGTQRGTVHYFVRKPNIVRVDAKRNGTQFTMISDGDDVYIDEGHGDTRIDKAKDSVLANLYMASTLAGVPVWLVDFFWSIDYLETVGDKTMIAAIPAIQVGGKTCDGYNIKYSDDDWNVWLERSEERRPCRVVSRRLDGSALTVQTNDLIWKTPAFTDRTFAIPRD